MNSLQNWIEIFYCLALSKLLSAFISSFQARHKVFSYKWLNSKIEIIVLLNRNNKKKKFSEQLSDFLKHAAFINLNIFHIRLGIWNSESEETSRNGEFVTSSDIYWQLKFIFIEVKCKSFSYFRSFVNY